MDKQKADDIMNHKIEVEPTERTIAMIWMEGYKAHKAEGENKQCPFCLGSGERTRLSRGWVRVKCDHRQ